MKALSLIADWIDSLNEYIGRTVSYLVIVVILVTFTVAVLRYGFSMGWVWMQELADWLHATVFMLAVGYTLLHDGHARVDVFYRTAKTRTKAIIDLVGSIVFVVPTFSILLYYSLPYVSRSWERWEVSKDAGGMPGLFLLKSVIVLFCVLLILQAISMAIRNLTMLVTGDHDGKRLYSSSGDSVDGV